MGFRLFWGISGILALLGAGWAGGLRLNLTTSLPFGVYRIMREPPRRGAIVLACLPRPVAVFALARGYVPQGGSCPSRTLPVGKVVLATAGDTVTVTPVGDLQLNGYPVRNSRRRAQDRLGRPLPQVPLGSHVLDQRELWLWTPSTSSFDSRYFGPVPVTAVRRVVRPVWTMVEN